MLILVGQRGDRVRRDPRADPRARAREPRHRHRRHRLRQRRQPARSRAGCSAARGRPRARRWKATRPTCAPTRTRRSASWSASALVSVTGAEWLDPVVALVIAVAIVVTGTRITMGSLRVLVDEALPDDGPRGHPQGDRVLRRPRRRRLPPAPHPPGRRAPLHRPARAVRPRHVARGGPPHRPRAPGPDPGRAQRRRRADPPRARGPRAPGRDAERGGRAPRTG